MIAVVGNSRLVAIKVLHTVIWAVMVAAIVGVPVAAVAGRWSWVLGLSGLVWAECAILVINGGRCPLTDWASKHTAERAPNFDIYLPRWLAQHNQAIFGSLFVGGELVALWCWMQ